MKLWAKILLGLFCGVVIGNLLPEFAIKFKPIGDLFINAIKMIIVPLIFSSLLVGVTDMKDLKKNGTCRT